MVAKWKRSSPLHIQRNNCGWGPTNKRAPANGHWPARQKVAQIKGAGRFRKFLSQLEPFKCLRVDLGMNIEPQHLILDTLRSIAQGFFERLPQLGIALLVLLAAFGVARLLRYGVTRVMNASHTRQSLIRLAKNLIGIASWIFGISIAVTIVFPSITPAKLIAGLGLTSVAIGFAFKDVFENFLAGVIILFRKKMRISDFIDCEGVRGKIEDISVRETHVRTTDGELVIVPNSYLFKNPLKVQTDKPYVRQELLVGVDYDADLQLVTKTLKEALSTCSSVK
ncbi:MAG: mechanosensitive ion channel family protein [Pseudomonadota bacterium]